MEARVAQPYRQPNIYREATGRQGFRHAHTSVGVAGPNPLIHLTRIGTALAPLIVLEAVKDPLRQTRWIRICSLAGAAVSETLWAMREQKRREQREMQAHYR